MRTTMATENNNKTLNVPNLRFPEFSGEWEHVALSEIAARVTRKNKDNASKLPLTISAQYGLVDQISFFNKVVASADMSNYYLLRQGEFAYNKSYSSDYPWGAIKRLDRYPQGALSSLYICFAVNDKVDSDFAVHYFESSKWHREVSNIAGEGARNHGLLNIAVGDFFDTKHRLPSSKEEQKKIAALLNLITERIATQIKIIEDLKKLKSAISKQIFVQKPTCWNRLDTLFSKGKAGGTPTSTNKDYYNGDIPFLSINDITKQGKYIKYTENHLSQSGLENSSAWIVPAHSLIMSMYASVGLVTINEVPIATSQAMFAMQLKDKGLLDYLYYYLSYFKYRHIHKYLETGTQSNINADIVRSIMIPDYGHGRNIEIASTLQSIDAKIDNELSILEQFNKQKNYLLSQMFI